MAREFRPFTFGFATEVARRVLEARIIPKRIKHRIEPEQHGSERWRVLGLLFRRERGDDFFKARIAAERVP